MADQTQNPVHGVDESDGSYKLSVDGDTVYPQPLPDSLIEQGTDWASDDVNTPTDAS